MAKPYVICHMCTTIDGKILTKRWGKLAGGKDSAALFETTAASFGIGAWLVGTTTMKEFAGRNRKLKAARGPVPRAAFVADDRAENFAIGADAKGVLRFQSGVIDGDHVVLLVTERVTDDYLAHLQNAGVSYVVCGDKEIDLPRALDQLRARFGIKKLMLQGGGKFNGALLAAGLVDEISQVIVPVVDGGAGVSGLFDIPGDAPKKAAATLRLTAHKKLPGGVNWFRYKVAGKPGK